MSIIMLDDIDEQEPEAYEPVLCPEYEQAWTVVDMAYFVMTAAPGMVSREALRDAREEVWLALDRSECVGYPESLTGALREALSLFDDWKEH
jgi:hypothetical protein